MSWLNFRSFQFIESQPLLFWIFLNFASIGTLYGRTSLTINGNHDTYNTRSNASFELRIVCFTNTSDNLKHGLWSIFYHKNRTAQLSDSGWRTVFKVRGNFPSNGNLIRTVLYLEGHKRFGEFPTQLTLKTVKTGLQISSASQKDSGAYRCEANFTTERAASMEHSNIAILFVAGAVEVKVNIAVVNESNVHSKPIAWSQAVFLLCRTLLRGDSGAGIVDQQIFKAKNVPSESLGNLSVNLNSSWYEWLHSSVVLDKLRWRPVLPYTFHDALDIFMSTGYCATEFEFSDAGLYYCKTTYNPGDDIIVHVHSEIVVLRVAGSTRTSRRTTARTNANTNRRRSSLTTITTTEATVTDYEEIYSTEGDTVPDTTFSVQFDERSSSSFGSRPTAPTLTRPGVTTDFFMVSVLAGCVLVVVLVALAICSLCYKLIQCTAQGKEAEPKTFNSEGERYQHGIEIGAGKWSATSPYVKCETATQDYLSQPQATTNNVLVVEAHEGPVKSCASSSVASASLAQSSASGETTSRSSLVDLEIENKALKNMRLLIRVGGAGKHQENKT